MALIRNWMLILLLVVLTENCIAQSFTVSGKKYFTLQPFSQRRTYQFINISDSLSINSFYLNDQSLKTNIQRAIGASINELGYQYKEHDPQIVIKYQVLNAPARLKGSKTFSKNAAATDTISAEYNVDPGTLVISFMDAASGKMLWQGFASGLIDGQAPRKNTALVNEAVRLVMQEYASLLSNTATQ
jgi:hypothetical protein